MNQRIAIVTGAGRGVAGLDAHRIILGAFKTDEDHRRDVPPRARTGSPLYLGRAIVALASDANVMAKTGGVHQVGDLAKEYGFTDLDGRYIPPFEM